MLRQMFTLKPSLEFKQVHVQILQRWWDKKLEKDPLAFVPHELRDKVSPQEAQEQNCALGDFASNQIKKIFINTSIDERLNNLIDGKIVVAVGFGRSYDCQWLREATLAGYQTIWIDISRFACTNAVKSMVDQWEKIPIQGMGPAKPQVIQGEIRSILCNKENVDLDFSKIAIWYFCRTLTCLSERSAKIVMKGIGESLSSEYDSEKNHKIQIVAAMRENNPNRIGATSKLYTTKKMISNIVFGAGRQVKVINEEIHMYFDQKYSSLTIVAK